jgi:hypothetical protein
MTAHHLTIVHYPPREPWRCLEAQSPNWKQVSDAIQAMDDRAYPIVQLSWANVESCFEDESSFNIIGGVASGFALFEYNPGWTFEDPEGSDEDVRLWQSDQGYYCKRKNIITEIDAVLKLAHVYFETGSYDEIRKVCITLPHLR